MRRLCLLFLANEDVLEFPLIGASVDFADWYDRNGLFVSGRFKRCFGYSIYDCTSSL